MSARQSSRPCCRSSASQCPPPAPPPERKRRALLRARRLTRAPPTAQASGLSGGRQAMKERREKLGDKAKVSATILQAHLSWAEEKWGQAAAARLSPVLDADALAL